MYPSLERPPVVVALAQIKFNLPNFNVRAVLQYDNLLMNRFALRRDNIQVGVDFGKTSFPLGESKVSAVSNAEVGSYTYVSKNQKTKLELSADTITYIDENPYRGWSDFKSSVVELLNIIFPLLKLAEVSRVSIRFVNRFTFEEFNDPKLYFNTLITSSDGAASYPLRQYGFRLMMDIPDSDIYSIVNHNIEDGPQNSCIYTFDIDVLDRQKLIFDIETIGGSLESLRQIKNKIFFDTLTDKAIQQCNSKN